MNHIHICIHLGEGGHRWYIQMKDNMKKALFLSLLFNWDTRARITSHLHTENGEDEDHVWAEKCHIWREIYQLWPKYGELLAQLKQSQKDFFFNEDEFRAFSVSDLFSISHIIRTSSYSHALTSRLSFNSPILIFPEKKHQSCQRSGTVN